ncbi:hypothetical protein HZH66_003494 [Vespula vulgaris]|uniref:Uncharacterized protein n=1 Tax=Vespula vulgaris TaxID=7454 RepID=A0A834KD91_VESVU|nr:hypothetical protein HZH66_003494 [Vespula vulgaris]
MRFPSRMIRDHELHKRGKGTAASSIHAYSLPGRRRLKWHRQRFTRINRQNGNRLVAHGRAFCGTRGRRSEHAAAAVWYGLLSSTRRGGRLRPMATALAPKMLERGVEDRQREGEEGYEKG